jgi:two-component system OmpR family response regulator
MVFALAKNPGHVKNRQQLMKDSNIYVDDSTITSHVKRIRKKFNQIDKDFNCIETVYGMGYRWNKDEK